VSVVQMKDVDLVDGIAWDSVVRTELPGRNPSVWLQDGDVIFTARGMNNRAIVVSNGPDKTVLSPHFFQIRTDPCAVLPEFLAWQLNQSPAQRYFAQSAEGSAVIGIRKSILTEVMLLIPSLEEQYRIVEMIRCWEKQRAVLNALQGNHLDMMNAIANDLLTRNK